MSVKSKVNYECKKIIDKEITNIGTSKTTDVMVKRRYKLGHYRELFRMQFVHMVSIN